MRQATNCIALTGLLLAGLAARPLAAQDGPTPAERERNQAFAEKMNGVQLVGHFTITGKLDEKPKTETYEIQSITKLPEPDQWQFKARIKYGRWDVTVPLNLTVKWAGDTPVITLTDFTIPALGTFSARVVFYNNKYAGTWTHGKVGGHLYGMIEKIPAPAAAKDDAAKDAAKGDAAKDAAKGDDGG